MREPIRATEDKLANKVGELKAGLSCDMHMLAEKSGSIVEGEYLVLNLFNDKIQVKFPELEITFKETSVECPSFFQTIILYYLTYATGQQPTGKWIKFGQLKEGMNYEKAFQGYTGNLLLHEFGSNTSRLETAAIYLGGKPGNAGDKSFVIYALPRVPMLAACWEADEEFPAEYQILFDETANDYMPTDGCAILGSLLTKNLIRRI